MEARRSGGRQPGIRFQMRYACSRQVHKYQSTTHRASPESQEQEQIENVRPSQTAMDKARLRGKKMTNRERPERKWSRENERPEGQGRTRTRAHHHGRYSIHKFHHRRVGVVGEPRPQRCDGLTSAALTARNCVSGVSPSDRGQHGRRRRHCRDAGAGCSPIWHEGGCSTILSAKCRICHDSDHPARRRDRGLGAAFEQVGREQNRGSRHRPGSIVIPNTFFCTDCIFEFLRALPWPFGEVRTVPGDRTSNSCVDDNRAIQQAGENRNLVANYPQCKSKEGITWKTGLSIFF